jgi:predicted nucleic acid-binding protein
LRVIFDTSPVCYLLLIGEIGILPLLFDEILITPAVAAELGHPKAPSVLRDWIANPPGWLQIHPPVSVEELNDLQAGERETILLAEELMSDLVVLDDLAARKTAKERGLEVTGLLGVLDRAALKGLIDLPGAIEKLRGTGFHAAPWLLKELLDRHTH